MTSLTNLSATPSDTPAPAIRGARAGLHMEPERGVFIHASVTGEGLYIYQGAKGIFIPQSELVDLFTAHTS